MNCKVLKLTAELIGRESITPNDAGCLTIIGSRLEALGFTLERLDRNGVSNLWATFGTSGPMVCFAGHTDVVPVGHIDDWLSPPFIPTLTDDGMLRGRGAADMKGSLAAMVVACEEAIKANAIPNGRISFLLTSDEEGQATDGTIAVVELLKDRQNRGGEIEIDYCIVGEPSSKDQLGDMVRVGRRGSLNAIITIRGIQGHVAYPELVDNPIHHIAQLINQLTTANWDKETNSSFPPTSFQTSNIEAGTGVTNVVPAIAKMLCNWRFSTSTSAIAIKLNTQTIIESLGIEASIEWNLSGEPFLTKRATLTQATAKVIREQTDLEPNLSTGGGTSDGRFIAQLGCELIELGPINRSIHQVDEEVKITDLPRLKDLYKGLLIELIG